MKGLSTPHTHALALRHCQHKSGHIKQARGTLRVRYREEEEGGREEATLVRLPEVGTTSHQPARATQQHINAEHHTLGVHESPRHRFMSHLDTDGQPQTHAHMPRPCSHAWRVLTHTQTPQTTTRLAHWGRARTHAMNGAPHVAQRRTVVRGGVPPHRTQGFSPYEHATKCAVNPHGAQRKASPRVRTLFSQAPCLSSQPRDHGQKSNGGRTSPPVRAVAQQSPCSPARPVYNRRGCACVHAPAAPLLAAVQPRSARHAVPMLAQTGPPPPSTHEHPPAVAAQEPQRRLLPQAATGGSLTAASSLAAQCRTPGPGLCRCCCCCCCCQAPAARR